ncbi:MAG TPA: hypothetical protein VF631_11055 [Allosphingosinicella sp.]|uniref:hypothetical protein n=1 Tax=Allosphingosinicella sp. TaxID=2823234 RepID=UPI002F29D799
MVFKKFLAGATALALVIAPEVAMAQTTAAVAARASATEVVPAAESFEGDSELLQERRRRRGFLIPLFAGGLVILALIIIFRDNDGAGVSPG